MPKTPSGKQSSLFSFFKKTPKPKDEEAHIDNEVLSAKRSPNSKKERSPRSKADDTPKAKNNIAELEWSIGDVVWCKLEGYPWWPGLVCGHPTHNSHIKKTKKMTQIHVQFFETTPSRAWIKAKYVQPFKGSDDEAFQRGGPYFTLNTKIRESAVEADNALAMALEDRLQLVVELLPSSEEEEDEEEEEVAEKMYFDPEIFDTEMSDDESYKTTGKADSPSEKKENHSPEKSSNDMAVKPKRKAAKIADMKSKRRKIIKSESGDEESEDDFKPPKHEEEEDDDDSQSSGVDEDNISDESASEPEMSPVKKTKRRAPVSKGEGSSVKKPLLSDKKPAGISPSVSVNTKSKLSLFSAPENSKDSPLDSGHLSFPHLKLEFMQPEKIRDKMKKNKSDPDYNPRTMFVPESFLNQQTPAMRQWWVLKSERFDTVLFFKVGKFYELYHMDAVTGVTELGLIYMKGDWAHSGFPEIAYTRYADALIQKGYKVARVEQTETPDMMQERCKQMGRSVSKYDKVVKREVCQVTSQGIRISTNLEGGGGADASNYILAVCEKENPENGCCVFGVCFIDTSIGTFHIGQFEDDRHLSRFRTLIAHFTPSQVLYERGKISTKTLQLINDNLSSAIKEALAPGTEFWESGKTLQRLSEEDYFKRDEDAPGCKADWPPVLKKMLSENDALGLTGSDPYLLAIRSLGALTWYLQYCLVDREMLSMKKFEDYLPLDNADRPTEGATATFDMKQRHMVLDGVTVYNLDLVSNGQTGTAEGSLLEKLNMCTTPFGKRLFHQWLCAPLCQPGPINDRLDAIDDLGEVKAQADECVLLMKKLPDLERLLGRIHTVGLNKGPKHPDSRAILYEEVAYSKRKIEDFLSTIEGFRTAVAMVNKFKENRDQFKSKVLRRSITVQAGEDVEIGCFPDIADDLEFFDQAFDHRKAKKDGIIVPSKGVDEDYDEADADIADIENKLGEYLDCQKKLLGCRAMVYWGTGKNRFQMEIPESATKSIPDAYELMSSKKGAKRFRTAEIDGLLSRLTDAEERKDASLKDIMRRIFHSFDERHCKWAKVVECLSVLDVLISLTLYRRCSELTLCRPEIVLPEDGAGPTLEVREGQHPCVARTFEGGDFIPNNTLIGVTDDQDEAGGDYSKGEMVLVTGPNMGGKSTLMRQVGLIVVMAQMGCYVPAEKCRLTPVDRIFTRLGASDRIMAGESTFFVELSETSSILQHATKHSLVLLDELGRGTATYDGTAIASSVVRELTERIGCRTLFSTHYHSLVEDYKTNQKIQLGHMACMVENENEEDPSQETITFLYKFVKGACPKSYGFNAARLAGIVEEVIQCAVKKAKQFEEDVDNKKYFRDLWHCSSDDDLGNIMARLQQAVEGQG